MIVHFANKTRFRDDILSNRIEEIVPESFQAKQGMPVDPTAMKHFEQIPSFAA